MTTPTPVPAPSIINPPLLESQWLQNQQASVTNALHARTFNDDEMTYPMGGFKSLLTTALSFIPTVGGFVAGAVDIYFTYLCENDFNMSKNAQNFRSMVKDLIDSSISTYDDATIKAMFAGMAKSFADFTSHCNNLASGPNDALKEAVRVTFILLESDVETKYIPECTKQTLQADELLMYSLYATSHLVLLREIALFGALWGFPPSTIQFYKDKFQPRLTAYTAYCTSVYKMGMDIIRKKTMTYSYQTWNNMNRFRNEMIINIFDFVQVWMFLDPVYYNQGIYVENCRVLFSDIYGATYFAGYSHDVSFIENAIQNGGHHQYQHELKTITQWANDGRITGIYSSFAQPDVADTKSYRNGAMILGSVSDPAKKNVVQFLRPGAIYTTEVATQFDLLPRRFEFKSTPVYQVIPQEVVYSYTNANWYSYKLCPQETNWYSGSVPARTTSTVAPPSDIAGFAGHKLHNMFGVSLNTSVGFYLDADIGGDSGGIGLPSIANCAVVGGICMAFVNERVFDMTIVYPSIINVVDPQKLIRYNNDVSLITDGVMPGFHQVRMAPATEAVYSFDPHDATKTKYEVNIKISTDNTNTGTLSWLPTTGLSLDKFTLTPYMKSAIIKFNPPLIIDLAKNRFLGQNQFKIQNNSNDYMKLEAIILKPVA
eukprot:gene1353-1548_t